jgi:hypothetical protein
MLLFPTFRLSNHSVNPDAELRYAPLGARLVLR